ncbi:hypothetical protein DA718_02185 [Klebsiella huaxiensis]|nr:hypothetical protein DA718_02185 [Klebsiella huaxiensis]
MSSMRWILPRSAITPHRPIRRSTNRSSRQGFGRGFPPPLLASSFFICEMNRFPLKVLRNFISGKRLHSHFNSFFNYFLTIKKHLPPPKPYFLR